MGWCRTGRSRKNKQKAKVVFSFAAGIMIASFFGHSALMVVLSVVLVMLGVAYLRCP